MAAQGIPNPLVRVQVFWGLPNKIYGPLEQRSARLPVTKEVTGSNPVRSATLTSLMLSYKHEHYKKDIFENYSLAREKKGVNKRPEK